ncbi:MAG TPA: hypothetical protein ENK86_04800, partial [Campylobacterales bacterium]|nr:hypothetical protein [Campylobacterales bacterium]
MHIVINTLLLLAIRLKAFGLLGLMLQVIPSKRPWVANKLLSIGYLEQSSMILKAFQPRTEYAQRLKERVDSMEKIRANGLNFPVVQKKRQGEKNILLALHNSLPYDKAGYAIRSHMLATNLIKQGIQLTATTRPGY